MIGIAVQRSRFLERFYWFGALLFTVPLTICIVLLIVSMTLPSKLELSLGDAPTLHFRMENHWVILCDHFENLEVIDAVEMGIPMTPAITLYRGADIGLCGFDFVSFADGNIVWSVHFSLVFASVVILALFALCLRRFKAAARHRNSPWMNQAIHDSGA